MTNCLGLKPLPPENPGEWPIMARKIFLGLAFIGTLALLGHCFGRVVTKDAVGRVLVALATVGIGITAWYRGANIPQSVFVQCALCGEWTDISTCQTVPNVSGLTCKECGKYL